MKKEILLERIQRLIDKGEMAVSRKFESNTGSYVPLKEFTGFRSSCLSFISYLYGTQHSYYTEFDRLVNSKDTYKVNSGIPILESIKEEIENDWLISIRKLAAAEVFADFLDMSKYFLDEGYKDPAAVMIGSVLEEHLRQLCANHSVDVTFVKGTDIVPKKADLLNADLAKKGVYGVLEQKNVTAWLDLRNRAAHGKYSEYAIEQVNLMYLGVLDFVSRIS